jgi:hypothetical protein
MNKALSGLEFYMSLLQDTEEYKLWNVNNLTIKDKNLFDRYISETAYPANVWSSNFAYMWAYSKKSDKLDIMHGRVSNMLVTFILSRKGRLYMPCLPYGKGSIDQVVSVLDSCANFCFKWNKESNYLHKPIVARINSCQLNYLRQSENFNQLFKSSQLSGIERHLSISNVISLSGRDFKDLRYKVNKFKRDNPEALLRAYDQEDFDDVVQLGKYWERTAGKRHKRILDEYYFEEVIRFHKELDIQLLVVELNGKIVGMIAGGVLPTGQAWGFITKFDKYYDGLSEYLVVEMIKKIHEIDPRTELINIGSDLGNERLASAKEKFRPVERHERFSLFYQNGGYGN